MFELFEKATKPTEIPQFEVDATQILEFSTKLFTILNSEFSVFAITAAEYDIYCDQESNIIFINLKLSIVPQSPLLYDNIPAEQQYKLAYELMIDLFINTKFIMYQLFNDMPITPAIQLYQPFVQSQVSAIYILSQCIFVCIEQPLTQAILEEAVILH
ncbi:Hypothetical_protein [Hexamita inflata]|uniref:Hypothetical_protein n=1 Tax=Hexamita inflata TaxID=28002 RepID=A0AA86UZB0_9EUKA|nr:Hypothetical protein HINF_LOCUS61859 [Hexamita inflata]